MNEDQTHHSPEEIEEICRKLDSLKEPLAHGSHAEFALRFKETPNSFRVNWISAFYAQRLLPWNYRLAWTCAGIVEFGLLLGGLALIIFGHWFIGLCAVVICICVIMPASRKTACQFILEHSSENVDFWKLMCERGVIVKAGESLPLPDSLWSDSTQGKTQEALRLVCLIRGREPADDSSEWQAQAALRLWHSGQREQALDHFNRAVELAPDDAVTLINRANLKFELGNLEDAMGDFERAQRGIAQRGYPKLPEYFFAGLELWRKMPPEERQAWIEKRRNVNITAF